MLDTIDGRKVGILIADGSDASALKKLKDAIAKAGATAFVVAPKVGKVQLSDGKTIRADGQLVGSPSQIFDAVAVLVSNEGAQSLSREAAAIQWVMDAFGHLKAIGYSEEGLLLLERAGIGVDAGVIPLDGSFPTAAAKRFFDREPTIRQLA